jgi:hypothetical protein
MNLPVTREGLVITERVDNLLIGEYFVDLRPISITVLMGSIQKARHFYTFVIWIKNGLALKERSPLKVVGVK